MTRETAQSRNTHGCQARIAQGRRSVGHVRQKETDTVCCNNGSCTRHGDHQVDHGVQAHFLQLFARRAGFEGFSHPGGTDEFVYAAQLHKNGGSLDTLVVCAVRNGNGRAMKVGKENKAKGEEMEQVEKGEGRKGEGKEVRSC